MVTHWSKIDKSTIVYYSACIWHPIAVMALEFQDMVLLVAYFVNTSYLSHLTQNQHVMGRWNCCITLALCIADVQ